MEIGGLAAFVDVREWEEGNFFGDWGVLVALG